MLIGNLEPGGLNLAPALLAIFAGITDILDGYIARKLNQITEWGKVLDPLADKACIAAIALQLYLVGRIDFLLAAIILGRDMVIVLASFIYVKKVDSVIPSNYIGKATVLIICFFVLGKMMYLDSRFPVSYYYFYLLVIGFSILSLAVYAIRGYKLIIQRAE
jgi:CDP-diacylglycerol--glycerol-3-phosphate 3-phosphatidyltransferase